MSAPHGRVEGMSAFPEAPFGSADRIEIGAAPLAVVRHAGVTIDDLREAFDRGYAALGGLFTAGTLTPAGPALAVYDGDPMDRFDLELGFPVVEAPSTSLTAADGTVIVASTLPAGPATATTALGPYDGLGDAWRRLVDRTVAAGLAPRGISIEIYVSDPLSDPGPLRTDLLLPVR